MPKSTSSGKRLAKNTLLLYLRTLLVMAIGLYTSRVVLSTLGVENYGIYNVIGGFVSLFTIAGGTLISATQRFLNYELGKKHDSNPNKVFCTAMGIHMMLSAFLLLLFETFGLWFLNAEMNIPAERMTAANIVYQFSILSFLIKIVSMPYNAVIIANEKMSAFAYISLLEASLHLAIALLLSKSGLDLLVTYSALLLCSAVLIRMIYGIYCKRHFPEITRFAIVKDKSSYKKQVSFASYTFLGSTASVLSGQGVNVVMNLFCGVAVNAARAIAVQVQHAVEKFVSDFMTALNPQIVKTYAAGEHEKSMHLAYQGAKFSFFLMLVFSLPIIFRTPQILHFWLKEYPDYAVEFVRFSLAYTLLTVLSKPIITEILATGEIKTNALLIGGLRILILPICYFALWSGYPPTVCYYIMIGIDLLALHVRLYILRSITGIPLKEFYKHVMLYIFIVSFLSIAATLTVDSLMDDSMLGNVAFVVISVVLAAIIAFFGGLHSSERAALIAFASKRLKKKKEMN